MKTKKYEEHWDLVIHPEASIFDLRLKEIWRYRDLIFLFVKRDFAAQYKQTILGPLWHIIQPVLTTAIFLVLFRKIANIPTDNIQPILFYLSGITLWNYFSACIVNTSNTFVLNAPIFGKVYFPRLVIPLSVVLSNIIRLGIQFALLILAMIYYNFNGYPIIITVYWLWIPVLVLLLAGLGLGMGIIISSLTTKYRDLAILITFIIQLLMYVTPIGYPMSYLKDSKYRSLIESNPVTSIVESFRFALFSKGNFDSHGLVYSLIFMLGSLVIGSIIFSRVERNFMDTV